MSLEIRLRDLKSSMDAFESNAKIKENRKEDV